MKNNKIGLLVHPFWMTLNGKKHLEHYSKIITSNKYDKLYVLVPMLNTKNRKDVLDLHFRNLLIYFLGLTETMIPSLDVKYFLSSNKNLVSNIPYLGYFILKTMVKFIKSIDGSIKRHKTKQDKLLFIYNILLTNKDFIMENIGDGILEYMFNGDLCTNKRINYIKKLLSVESKTKVIPLYYGAIGVFEVLAHYNDDFEGVENIDVFGEYYNVCVLGAAKYLFREEKIKVKLIKEHSIYFNKNNYLQNILKKNKDNTYLAVYNPEIIDEKGNLIKSKKYYGRK